MTEKTLTLGPLDHSAMCYIIYAVLGDCEELRTVVHSCLTADPLQHENIPQTNTCLSKYTQS